MSDKFRWIVIIGCVLNIVIVLFGLKESFTSALCGWSIAFIMSIEGFKWK